MAACKQCGADASGIACDFCGAIQSPPRTLEDELEALQAIAKAAQHVASNVDAGNASTGNALQDMAMANQRAQRTADLADAKLAAFWANAWLPSQPDALLQVVQSALAGVRFSGDGLVMQASLANALIARAEAAVDAFEMRAPGDARVHTLKAKVQAKKAERDTAQKAVAKNSKMVGIAAGVLGVVIIAIPVALSLGNRSDEPIPVSMHGEWVITPDATDLDGADLAVTRCRGGDEFWCKHDGGGNAASRLGVTPGGMTFKAWKDDTDAVSIVHKGQRGDGPQDDGSYKFRSAEPECAGTLSMTPDGKLMISLAGDSECTGFSQTWLRKK